MSDGGDDPATLRFLIEQKIAYINATVNIGMLWWASSIVFSGSVLAAVWSNQDELVKQPPFLLGLGIVLFVFFFVIAYFGHLVAMRVGSLQDEIAKLADGLGYGRLATQLKLPKQPYFQTERRTFQISMWLGAGSFALIWLAWVGFWMFLSGRWTRVFIGIFTFGWSVVWFTLRRRKMLP